MAWSDLLKYTSVRYIQVKNWKIASLYYAICIAIFTYVTVYSIIMKKGYHELDYLVGTTSVKVKGSGVGVQDGQIYDVYDIVVPPLEADAAFISTRLVTTVNQTKSICSGLASDGVCNPNVYPSPDCVKGNFTMNGQLTGRCSKLGYCELSAWCPIENPNATESSSTRDIMLDNIENFSVFAKVNIEFPTFGVARSNVHKDIVRGLNLFYVQDILQSIGHTYDQIKENGAIVLASLKYTCDLDGATSCQTDWTFSRIDESSSITDGFNYRYTKESTDLKSGFVSRTLVKAYGIRIVFHLYGTAGKFSVVPLMLAIGSGIGLLAISKVICDFILLYCASEKSTYRMEKIRDVYEHDDPMHAHQPEFFENMANNNDAILNQALLNRQNNL